MNVDTDSTMIPTLNERLQMLRTLNIINPCAFTVNRANRALGSDRSIIIPEK